MPKKRFIGGRQFQTLGGAPQAFGHPDGAMGARPMALKQGNQSQWLGSSRVGTLMRQDIFMGVDSNVGKSNGTPRRPEGVAANGRSPNVRKTAATTSSPMQSSWGVQQYASAKGGPKTDVYGTNPKLPSTMRKTPERIPDMPPPLQPLAETALNRQVNAYSTIPSLDKMYYTDPSPLPVPRKTQFNRSDLVKNRIECGDHTAQVTGRRCEVGFGEAQDKLIQYEFNRDGFDGKLTDWSISGDAPAWMHAQQADKGTILRKQKTKDEGFKTSFVREPGKGVGHKGKVTDWSISSDGPNWMTSVLDKYDPEAILEPTVHSKGKAQFFSVSKNKEGMAKDHAIKASITFDRTAAGLGALGGHTITDSSTSADMPSFIANASRRILGPSEVLEPPENANKNWYNRQSYGRKPKYEHQHASFQSTKISGIGGKNGGMASQAEHSNGCVISDSTVSGDAPSFMVNMSMRVDPKSVYSRPNNQLNFINKQVTPGEKPSQWKYDDSSVSGDGPTWMTETSARIAPNILVEPEKRSFVNKDAKRSHRKPDKKPDHVIREGRTRTKPTKWTTDVERDTLMTTRKPYVPPSEAKRWVR